MTKFLRNKCLSFRQLKCGESHMTYLARNTVNGQRTEVIFKLLTLNAVKFLPAVNS
jgi:hypothetical protein